MTKTNKKLREEYYRIFREPDKVYDRFEDKWSMDKVWSWIEKALQAKDEEIVGKIEKFRSELEGIEEMVSLDSILYKFDDFLSSLKKGDKTK